MPDLKVVRVVGPPGAGKSLLITTLIEEMRVLGHFVATSAPRGEDATVITTSSAARVTVERPLAVEELCRLVASLDPRAALLLAESLDAPGIAAIEVVPAGARPSTPAADLLAAISSAEVVPGGTAAVAALIERRVLRGEQPKRSRLARLFRGG